MLVRVSEVWQLLVVELYSFLNKVHGNVSVRTPIRHNRHSNGGMRDVEVEHAISPETSK